MTKLEALRGIVNQMFEHATEKDQIEQLAKINNSIDEVEKEQQELTDKNAELIESYKKLVKHTSFKEAPKVDTPTGGPAPTLEESLKSFLASHPDENK